MRESAALILFRGRRKDPRVKCTTGGGALARPARGGAQAHESPGALIAALRPRIRGGRETGVCAARGPRPVRGLSPCERHAPGWEQTDKPFNHRDAVRLRPRWARHHARRPLGSATSPPAARPKCCAGQGRPEGAAALRRTRQEPQELEHRCRLGGGAARSVPHSRRPAARGRPVAVPGSRAAGPDQLPPRTQVAAATEAEAAAADHASPPPAPDLPDRQPGRTSGAIPWDTARSQATLRFMRDGDAAARATNAKGARRRRGGAARQRAQGRAVVRTSRTDAAPRPRAPPLPLADWPWRSQPGRAAPRRRRAGPGGAQRVAAASRRNWSGLGHYSLSSSARAAAEARVRRVGSRTRGGRYLTD